MSDHDMNDFPNAETNQSAGEPEFEIIGSEPVTETPAQSAEAIPPRETAGKKKPVVCLMGEFSAGKSTLSNLLMGNSSLPVNVTATQLPPVWIAKGDEPPYRVALDDGEYDIDLDRIEDVSVDDTSHIRIFHDAELLDICDLIDMPGISDPNMDAEVWQRVIHKADIVIWCTHATQAWRQSEAAVWSMLPPELYEKSFLLLTRMDKILSERDQMRVVKRVGRETVGLFRELFPISLTRALAAGEDTEKWQASGAAAFLDGLKALVNEIAAGAEADEGAVEAADDVPMRSVMPTRVKPKLLTARPARRRPEAGDVSDPLASL